MIRKIILFTALLLVVGLKSQAQTSAEFNRANQQYVLFESERDKGTNMDGMYAYLLESYRSFMNVLEASDNNLL